MKPDLTDDKITATCDVRDTTFARFGVSGWYWWNGVTWGVLPSPLHTEPMLDAIVARDAEIRRLRADNERLRGLIGDFVVATRQDDTVVFLTARDALYAAATPKEDDR